MFKHSFILLLSITSLNFTYCMISEFKYKPWVQCPNVELSKKRETGEVSFIHDIETRRPIGQERNWRCFNYAMYQTTGSIVPLYINTIYNEGTIIEHMASIDIEKLFDQIQGPEEGALVLYTDDDNRIQHFAVVMDNVTFESKWGDMGIMQHKPFDVPYHYGNNVSFWKLKEKFTTTEGRKILLEIIKKDAEDFNKEFQQLLQNYSSAPNYSAFALGVILGIGGLAIINWLSK